MKLSIEMHRTSLRPEFEFSDDKITLPRELGDIEACLTLLRQATARLEAAKVRAEKGFWP